MQGIIALLLLLHAALLMALLGLGPFAKQPFQRYHQKLQTLHITTRLVLKRICQLVIALCLLYFLGFIR